MIRDAWGTIKFTKPGVFIAGGTGITPFISILRHLRKKNKIKNNSLFFSNKTESDIILKKELKKMLGENCHFILTKEKNKKYHYGRINEEYFMSNIENFNQLFYICGPGKMVLEVKKILIKLGAETKSIIFEK